MAIISYKLENPTIGENHRDLGWCVVEADFWYN
jgi:hypothetical protein